MKGLAMIAQALVREEIDSFFCFPQNPLIDAFAAADIRPIVCRQERVGVNMADGYSKTSRGRRLGVFVSQWGPGAENAFPGVAQAYANGVPMLVLPGAQDSRRLDVLPNFWAARNFEGVTKWATTVPSTDRIPDILRRAFFELRTGRPGPVMVEVPADVGAAEVDDALFDYRPMRGARSLGDPSDVREVASLLLKASAPMIHAGQGVLYAEATPELIELAEILQMPVMTTLPGKSAFPEDHPLALGSGGSTTTGPVAHFLRKADVVLGVGCSFSRSSFAVTIPPGKVLAHITNNEWDINKDYRVEYGVLGDAKLVLQQLIDEVRRQIGSQRRDGPGVAEEITAVKAEWMKEWMPHLTSDETPMSPYRIIWELGRTVDRRNTIVTHDSGGPRNQIVPFYEPIAPGGYLGWGKSTQLGYSLGGIMGAKLAEPDKLCVNVMGDAAIGMVGMDFETAVRSHIPILTLVFNNGIMAAETRMTTIASEKFDALAQGGNYSEVARALGGWCERVTKPEEIVPALKRGIEVTRSGSPALLEFITKQETAVSNPLR